MREKVVYKGREIIKFQICSHFAWDLQKSGPLYEDFFFHIELE